MSTDGLEAWFFPSWPDNATVVPFGAAIVAGWWSDFSEYTGSLITSPDGLVDVYMVDVQTRQIKLAVISGINVNRTEYFVYNISDTQMLSTEFWEFDLVKAGDLFLDFVDFVRSPRFSIRNFKVSSLTSSVTTPLTTTSGASKAYTTVVSSTTTASSLIIPSATSTTNPAVTSPVDDASLSFSKAAIAGITLGSVFAGALLMLACLLLVRIMRSQKNINRPDTNTEHAPELGPPKYPPSIGSDAKIGQCPTRCGESGRTDNPYNARPLHELAAESTMVKVLSLPEL